MGESCKNCRHYRGGQVVGNGECHRAPPSVAWMVNDRGQLATWGVFPPTREANVCGEHMVAIMVAPGI